MLSIWTYTRSPFHPHPWRDNFIRGKTITFVSDDGHTAAYKYFGDRGCNFTNPNPPPIPPDGLNCSDPKQVQICLELAAYQENAMAACAAAEGCKGIGGGGSQSPDACCLAARTPRFHSPAPTPTRGECGAVNHTFLTQI